MKTPADKKISLTFYSHPMKDLRQRWKALLVFAPGSTDETPAEITVVDGEGVPVREGSFAFAGRFTKISDGKGAIRCGDFVKGKHETGIWLHRPGQAPVPGALTFE